MVKWSVIIAGVGKRVVKAKDIDGAYAAAVAEYGCKTADVLAVFSNELFLGLNEEQQDARI